MDRSLDLKTTHFRIPEVYLDGRSMALDVIQCNSLYIAVKDSEPNNLTFIFNIKENPNLVGGVSELRDFLVGIDNFSKLCLNDDYIIRRAKSFFAKNPGWKKYPWLIRFSFPRSGLSKDFNVTISNKNSELIFEKEVK
jgi:hypothetical protein